MKKIMMAMTLMFAFGCFAQTSAGGSSSSGSMGPGQSGASSGSMGSQSGSMDNGSMKSGMKGEKTMKGCIESENGGYMLEEKGGKEVMLTGSDLSAHVGHMVKVHGMWQSGSMNSGSSASNSSDSNMTGSSNSNSSMSGSSNMDHHKTGKMDHNGQSFMVNKIDMISDQCKMDKGMSH